LENSYNVRSDHTVIAVHSHGFLLQIVLFWVHGRSWEVAVTMKMITAMRKLIIRMQMHWCNLFVPYKNLMLLKLPWHQPFV